MPLLNIFDPLNLFKDQNSPNKKKEVQQSETKQTEKKTTETKTPEKGKSDNIDINHAIDRTVEIIKQIDATKHAINEAIKLIEANQIKEAVSLLDKAYDTIECNKCRSKILLNQAKLQVAELSCELGDESCKAFKEDIIAGLKYLYDTYLNKVEKVNVSKIKKALSK